MTTLIFDDETITLIKVGNDIMFNGTIIRPYQPGTNSKMEDLYQDQIRSDGDVLYSQYCVSCLGIKQYDNLDLPFQDIIMELIIMILQGRPVPQNINIQGRKVTVDGIIKKSLPSLSSEYAKWDPKSVFDS
jgi:hypothetical protein